MKNWIVEWFYCFLSVIVPAKDYDREPDNIKASKNTACCCKYRKTARGTYPNLFLWNILENSHYFGIQMNFEVYFNRQ